MNIGCCHLNRAHKFTLFIYTDTGFVAKVPNIDLFHLMSISISLLFLILSGRGGWL